MKRRVLVLLAGLLLIAGSVHAAGEVSLSAVTDRPDAMYKCGEEAAFKLAVAQDGAAVTTGSVSYVLSLDGGKELGRGTADLGANGAEVKGTLDAPGILRCTATFAGGEKPAVALAAAAFDPEGIQPTTTEPADFGEFWSHWKDELAQVPADAKLEKSEAASDANATIYKISLGNIRGSRVYGWFGVPVKPGKYPALLNVPYAGVYPQGPGWVDWAKRGFIAMGISAHDYDVDMPQEKYDELNKGPLGGYPGQGKDSRETYYFLRTFLSIVRSIDYLTSRPEWDGKSVIVTGSSQGGGLSVVAAGLDPRVTAISANVPAMCDHTGATQGRPSGWPHHVAANDANALQVSAYFDACNFARHITCPTLMAVGLIDGTCPATTVYSAFNVIRGPKQMVASPLMGHSVSKEYSDLSYRWIPGQAAAKGGGG